MKVAFRGALAGAALAALLGTGAHAANLIQNGGFEAPVINTISGPFGDGSTYVYPATTVDDWTYAGGTGLINGFTATPWFSGSPPSGFGGSQYAFVQGGSTSVLSQSFTSGAGEYLLSWLEGSRPDLGCCNGAQTYQVELDNTVVGTFSTPNGQNFELESLDAALSAGTHTLSFVGDTDGDHTAFLDNVSISAAPEPATWATLLLGVFGLGGVLRSARRKPAAALLAG